MITRALLILVMGFMLTFSGEILARVRGIYLNQSSVENESKLKDLITNAQQVGINTFIIDLHHNTTAYKRHIPLVIAAKIAYVVRIVVFPEGAKAGQVSHREFWQKKWSLMKQAIDLGASAVQLDYIRYSSKQPPSAKNAHDIKSVISWFKNELSPYGVELQIDVFGESMFMESRSIGQNLPLFGNSVDVVCPMLYPSHFFPYALHSQAPYKTIAEALAALPQQFAGQPIPFKIVPYFEVYNFRYPRMSANERHTYIRAQIRAIEDSPLTTGWQAWSANNVYHHLFEVLKASRK